MNRSVVVLAAACLWLGLEHAGMGPFSFFDIHDTADGSPITMAMGPVRPDQGLWLPWVACGVDRLANDMPDIRLIPLAFRLLPGWLAYQILVLGQFFLCAYSMFRLCRDRLGMGELPSVFSGLAVLLVFETYPSCQTLFTLGFQAGFALLPFMLWSLDGLEALPTAAAWRRVIMLGLLQGVCSSVGSSLPFIAAAVVLWFGIVRGRTGPRFWAMILVFMAAAGALQLRTAWAMALNARLSHRADWALGGGALAGALAQAWANLMTIKALALLSLAGLAWTKGKDRLVLRLGAGLIVCAACGELGDYLKPFLPDALGFLKGFKMERFGMLLPLFAAPCAGRALESLPRPKWFAGAALAVLLVSSVQLKSSNMSDWYFFGSYASNFGSPVLRDLASLREEPFRVASFTHGLNPSYANAYGLETVDGYMNVYPRSYQRFWSAVIDPLTEEDAFYKEYFNLSGSKIYLFLRDAEPFVDGLPFSRFYRLPLLSLANAKYILSRIPLVHADLEAVREPPAWPKGDRKARAWLRIRENFAGKSHLYVYRNKTVLPRAFLARDVRFFDRDEDMREALVAAEADGLRRTVFLPASAAPAVGKGPFEEGTASFAAYGPDRLEVLVGPLTRGPGLLVISNSLSPYWKCEIDGSAAPILPAYGAFWAVPLPAGSRRVVFRYEPPYRVGR